MGYLVWVRTASVVRGGSGGRMRALYLDASVLVREARSVTASGSGVRVLLGSAEALQGQFGAKGGKRNLRTEQGNKEAELIPCNAYFNQISDILVGGNRAVVVEVIDCHVGFRQPRHHGCAGGVGVRIVVGDYLLDLHIITGRSFHHRVTGSCPCGLNNGVPGPQRSPKLGNAED